MHIVNQHPAVTELAKVTAQIEELEDEHTRTSARLGEALARMRTGDKKAEAEAGKSSFKRAGIEGELKDLRLTQTALKATVDQWTREEAERSRQQALAELQRITTEARNVEKELALRMKAAVETAQRLRALGQDYQQARRAAVGMPEAALLPLTMPPDLIAFV
jgi:hypothetical protein